MFVMFQASAHAQPATPEPIVLEYSAPAGCPDADAFFAGVRARANASRATRAEHGERTFRVAIGAGDPLLLGTLEIVAADGATTREVSGATCAETVSALALVAALAIEERAAVPVRPAGDGAAGRGRGVERRVERGSAPWGVTVGAGFGRYDGVAPSAAYGIPVFVAIARGHQQARLGVAVTGRAGDAMADFRWTSGRVEACPYVVAIDRVDVAPCLGFEAGAIDARGLATGMPASDLRPWLAPDGVLRLTVHIGPAAVELEGALAVPLVRDRFFIAPSTTVHETPAITSGATANLAFSL